MVDIVANVVWFRICETAGKLVNSLNVDGSTTTMDPLGLLLLGWIVLAGIVYFATDYIKNFLTRAVADEPQRGAPGRIPGAPSIPVSAAAAAQRTGGAVTAGESRFPVSSSLTQAGGPRASASPSSASGPPVANSSSSETLQARVKLINNSQEGSDWVNCVLNWLYHRYNSTPEFADIWLSALNEHAKRNAQQLGILVTFDRFLQSSCAPKVGDVRAELAADDQMSIFCSVETIELGFHLLATVTDARGFVNTSSYEVDIDHAQDDIRILNINDLRQQQPTQLHMIQCFLLKMLIHTSLHNELLLSAEFEPAPREIPVRVRTPYGIAPPEDEDATLVQHAVRQCIQNTVTTIRLARFRDFPFPIWYKPSSKPSSPTPAKEPLQTHFPFPTTLTNGPKINPFRDGNYQVIVKVIRASSIGDNAAGIEPYCVIEMDEPPQKHTTTVARATGANPAWEEKFTLDVSPDSSEMLFELYDRAKPPKRNFLGTAIVSLHELQRNPTQRQIIPLQSRPLMNDSVSGSLTLEFSVLAGGVPLSNNVLEVSSSVRPSGSPKPVPKSNRDSNTNIYAGTVLENLAAGEFPPGDFRPGTFKVPNVQRSHSEDIPLSTTGSSNNISSKTKRKLTLLSVPKSATDGQIGDADRSSVYDTEGRKRKTSFFGRIKRRFSFGRKRSKSLDPAAAKEEMRQMSASTSSVPRNGLHDQSPVPPDDGDTDLLIAVENGRSRKQDRQARKDAGKRSKSAPGSREPSASRSTASNKSTRATWREKLRSRFSKSQDHTPAVITTQEIP